MSHEMQYFYDVLRSGEVYVAVHVHCSVCDKGTMKIGALSKTRKEGAESAFRILRSEGWQVEGETAICPACSKQEGAVC